MKLSTLGTFLPQNYTNGTPDGSTDNTAAILAAIAAASAAGGGEVLLSRGEWVASQRIDVPSRVYLKGMGRRATRVRFTDSTKAGFVWVSGTEYSGVKDMAVCYSSLPNRNTSAYPFHVTAKHLQFENLEVYNAVVGIALVGCEDVNVYGCHVHDTSADGIATFGIPAPNKRIKVIANYCWNNGDDAISCNTYIDNGVAQNEDCVIALNSIRDSGATGVSVWGAKNITVTDNYIENTFVAGIKIAAGEGFTAVDGVKVHGNTVVNASQRAIGGEIVSGVCGGIAVFSYTAGFTIKNVDISGNTVRTPQGNYIFAYSKQNGNDLFELNICGNILLGGNAAVASVGGKESTGNTHGIFVNHTSKVNVSNNRNYDARQDGVNIGSLVSGAVQVQGNYVENCSTSANGNAAFQVSGGLLVAIGNSIHDPNNRITNAFKLNGLTAPICSATMNQLGGRAIA